MALDADDKAFVARTVAEANAALLETLMARMNPRFDAIDARLGAIESRLTSDEQRIRLLEDDASPSASAGR